MARSVEELLAENNELLRRSLGKGGSGRGGGGGAGMVEGATSALGEFGGAIKKTLPGTYELQTAFKKTVDGVSASLDTWRELSKTGVNFGNDILAMQTAAKGARMELGEFNEIVTQNRASLAGWGGSIDKGAKDFARVSKQMFDEYQGTTDSLRQLGYTNKDLNEVLALQMSAIGTSMAEGKAKDEAAIKAATDLAREMDLMAKMTGKTREEQMEAQKKLQMDQAFQAKMALETQGMDEKQALEYTTKMKEEYAKAEAQGLGQVFKEQFLYGTVVTKEASMQLVASGKAGLAVSEQAKAASEGNFKLAAEKSKEAFEEAGKMAKDPAVLQMRVISGLTGDFGKATVNFAKETEALAKGIEGLRKKIEQETGKPVTTEQATEAYRKQAEKDQKNVPPSTATVVNLEQRAKDAASAFQSGFVDPLIKQSYPALEKFNKGILGSEGLMLEFIKKGEAALKGGFNAANSGKALKDVPVEQQPTYMAARVQDAINRGTGESRNQYEQRRANERGDTAKEAPKKELGGIVPGTIGGTTVTVGEKGNPEAIVPLDKLDSMLKSSDKSMPKAVGGVGGGIDLSKIAKDIKTTTSKVEGKVEVTNWPKEITDLKKLTPVQTQPAPPPAAAPAPPPAAPAAAPAEPKKEDNKTQADTAFQEKMLLNTRNMNEKDAAEYKKKIAEDYAKAEALGMGQLFKDQFLNGKELSKEAQDKIAAATIQSNKETAAKSADDGSKKAEAKVEAYTIKAGDNLSKIAKAAGVSIADIMKANPQIKDPNKIFAGAKIEIPGIKKEEVKKEEVKKEEVKKEEKPAETKKAADDEAAIAREDLASLEAARAKNQKEAKVEPKPAEGTSSESYKINGKEVSKKDFDNHMEANPELAGLMKGIQPRSGGDAAGGGDPMAAALENVKTMQEQIGKVNEEAAQKELENKKDVVQQTQEAIDEESMVKQKAIDAAQALTKKSEELATRRASIEERLADRQGRVAALREIAGERDLTDQEKRELKSFENGVKRAENNLKRNLEEQAKVDEALGKAKKESNDKEIKSAEQQARDDIDSAMPSKVEADRAAEKAAREKMELNAIDLDEQLEAAQIDVAAQAKFTHVDKDKIGEDIDSALPSKSEADLAAEKAAREKMELNAIDLDEELEAAQIDTAAQAKFTHVDKDKIGEDIDSIVPSKGASDAEMKAVEAQDKIDKAIERQKEAQQKLNDLLMGASEKDIGEQYELYARQLDEANQNLAKVVDESMGDLALGIKNSGDDYANNTADIMDDIKSLIPGPTDAEMKAAEAQDNIDKAIAKQKEAQEKLASISEDDEDFLDKYEMAAQELKEANENLSKVVDESMGDLIGTVEESSTDFSDSLTQISDDIDSALPKAEWQGQTDEFGGMESPKAEWQGQTDEFGGMESPKAEWQGQTDEFGGMESPAAESNDTLDRSKISFGKVSKIDPKTGLPVLAEPKKDDKTLPKVENKDKKAEEDRQAADAKKAAEANSAGDAKKTGEGSKPTDEKNLNDVVKSLDKLNTAMEKLISVNNANSSLLRDQIKATKTSGTRNLYEVQ